MGAELGVLDGPIGTGVAGRERLRDRRFFTGMALVCLLVVLVGFAPTYYLSPLLGTRPLSLLVHLHGAVFTLWTLLFLSQASLVAARRTDIHRRLGVAGGALAVIMLVVGYLTAIEAARHGVAPRGRPPLEFLSVPLGTLLVFVILVGAGLGNRRRSEIHKRWMLLASIALLPPAFARMLFIGSGGPPVAIGGTTLLVAACMIYDRAAHGRVHPVFLWGGLFLVLSFPARIAIGTTEPWLSLARWLVR
jgi:uncharacterized membrane protein YozB (DUF420 family)